jgi:hypothetical protein
MNLRIISDRYKALSQVNEVTMTKSTAEEVFGGMCRTLRRLLAFDRAGLSLYESDRGGLQIVALCGPHEDSIFRLGHLMDRKTSQTGWVFEHQTYIIRRDLESPAHYLACYRRILLFFWKRTDCYSCTLSEKRSASRHLLHGHRKVLS